MYNNLMIDVNATITLVNLEWITGFYGITNFNETYLMN